MNRNINQIERLMRELETVSAGDQSDAMLLLKQVADTALVAMKRLPSASEQASELDLMEEIVNAVDQEHKSGVIQRAVAVLRRIIQTGRDGLGGRAPDERPSTKGGCLGMGFLAWLFGKREPRMALESCFSFGGLRHGDSRADVIRLFGEPQATEAHGSTEELKFLDYHWNIETDTATSKVARICVNRQPGVDFVHQRGIRDAKLDFIGKKLPEIRAAFGAPHRAEHGLYEYEFSGNGGKRGKVSFVCYAFHDYECIEITVSWI